MKCPTCHEEYATTEGFNAHVPSCGYKDNPLPEPKMVEIEPERVEKPKTTKKVVKETGGK